MLGLMFAVMYLIAAIAFIEPIKEQITIGRDSNHLDCTNSSISTGTKSTCIIVDWYLPYFVGVVIAVGMGLIGIRRLRGDGQ